MRDYRESSEALDGIPISNKLGLQKGPQELDDRYGHFGEKPLPPPLWDRFVAWLARVLPGR